MRDNLEAKMALEQLNITTLFEKKVIEKIQKTISEATGLAFVVIDYKGEPMTERTGFTSFCLHTRCTGSKYKTCRSSDAFGSISAAVAQKPFVYLCPSGLLEVAFPLVIKNHYLGGFIGGQIRVDNLPSHIPKLENIYKQVTNSQFSNEEWELFEKVPKMTYEKFMTITEFISVVLGYFVEKEVLRVQDEKVLTNLQFIEQWQNKYEGSMEYSKKLINAIEIGDFSSVYYYIPKTIEVLYQRSQGDIDQVSGTLKEIQAQFVHSINAVDIDSYFEEIENFDSFNLEMKEVMRDLVRNIYLDENLLKSIFSLEEVDINHKVSVEYWLFKAIDYILQQRVMNKSKKFQQVFNYINQNINENIGLTEITQECNVSQGYLSRVFRQHLNISVMNYLHMKKLYLAKVYLYVNDFSITDVTYQLGYNEVSYFMKVFKKYEQMTVNQYKLHYYSDEN